MLGREDTNNYLELFLHDTPMIDTRAPVEFARGAFPGAVNLPLMTDEERARIGTCYKEQGQDAAIELGHRLVSGETKAQRVQRWLDFANQHPQGFLYCFRGGLRSKICKQWLAEAGCDYPRVVGGYKAMRRFLIDSLEKVCQERPLVILAGHTGAAKTELLNTLPTAVDLEGLAHHRGSAFGRRPGGQPAQIDFENTLAIQLLRKHHRLEAGRPIALEDEGGFIGSCTLPEALRSVMVTAPVVVVDVDLETRVEHSFKNYILDNLQDWQQRLGEEAGFQRFANDLRDSLSRVRRRLGGLRYDELSLLLESAINSHRQGDESQHKEWIRPLLRDYYDPMYDYQLQNKAERVAFRGDRDEVIAWLNARSL
jgi:tRNA 2-selenouridine synthase